MTRQIQRLGILGSGQLGRMLALSAAPLGIECCFYDEAAGTACSGLGTTTVGSYKDEHALAAFAAQCDIVTYEFENIPYESAVRIAAQVPVFPPPQALKVSQDRLTEKTFLRDIGVATPNFTGADSEADLPKAFEVVGYPCVVKTRRLGYDGKGQEVICSAQSAEGLWERLGGVPLIIEQYLNFERELSVIAARSSAGETAVYPLSANTHKGGILKRSETPAPNLSEILVEAGVEIAEKILRELQYVGVLAVELFEIDGRLVVNEIAPRVHNSGHGSIDGSVCSQFENHVRAVCGLPLGSVGTRTRVVMLNAIGTLPSTEAIATLPYAKLHLYGKEARPGRKIGHVNLLDPSSEEELVATRILQG